MVWQKDLVHDFSDDQWDAMCQDVFSLLSCNKIIEQNYKFMHMYLIQLRLSKIYPNSSSRCHQCKTCTGSIIHVFWKCKKLEQFWKEVHHLTVKVLKMPLDISPVRYLFGTELNRTLDPLSLKRMGIISYIGKKCNLLNWNQQRPPTFTLFKQILNDTLRLEQCKIIHKK